MVGGCGLEVVKGEGVVVGWEGGDGWVWGVEWFVCEFGGGVDCVGGLRC